MIDILVLPHSWLRWVVIVGGLYTAFRCLRSWLWKLPWKGEDNYFVWAFGRAFLYQGVFGLILYLRAWLVLPPRAVRLGVPVYWPIVHGAGMLAVLAFFHGAKALVARHTHRERRPLAFAALLSATLLLILALIPWPFYRFGRPLLRMP